MKNEPDTTWEKRALAAEETVRVLKAKVLQMYNGGPQSQVHKAAEKARVRQDRNNRRRELVEVRAEELGRHNEHLEAEVERRTRATQIILDNVTFGFVRIDREMRVLEGFTRSCEELCGRAPQVGDPMADLLGLDPSREAQLRLGVEQVFEDLMPEEVTLDQLPRRFEHGDKVLSIEGRVIREDCGRISSILLTVSDITPLERAERESRDRDVLIGVLRQKAAFEQFVTDTRLGLETSSESLTDHTLVRRFIHTVKGNAASWGLDELTDLTHRIEERDQVSESDLDSVAGALRDFLDNNRELLGVDFEVSDPGYEVHEEGLRELRRIISDPARIHEVNDWVSAVVMRPVHELVGPAEAFVAKLAERLQKDVAFSLIGGDLLVDAEVMRPVMRNLSHLIRNAVDHGIEPSWQRAGKNAIGAVRVRLEDNGTGWTLRVEDDGRGIMVDELVASAVSGGYLEATEAADMTREEKVMMIFTDGLSTASVATDVSGRGLGMPAVKEAVTSLGGTIGVETGPDGTAINITIPRLAAVERGAGSADRSCAE